MEKEIVKKYTNNELTIVWKPETCIHAGICVATLPKVYNPTAKPWITMKNATTTELIAQIKKCPSGALSYYMNNDEPLPENTSAKTKIEVLKNGPLLVYGALKIEKSDGSTEEKSKVTAFCRCGASKNKPYCDGTHKKIDWKG